MEEEKTTQFLISISQIALHPRMPHQNPRKSEKRKSRKDQGVHLVIELVLCFFFIFILGVLNIISIIVRGSKSREVMVVGGCFFFNFGGF